VSDVCVAAVQTPAKPLVCLWFAAKQTSRPVRGAMGYRIGWENVDACVLRVRVENALMLLQSIGTTLEWKVAPNFFKDMLILHFYFSDLKS
jgi:hypothetical protein